MQRTWIHNKKIITFTCTRAGSTSEHALLDKQSEQYLVSIMSFTIYDNDIIMCTGDNVLIQDSASDHVSSISLPKLMTESDLKVHNNVDIDAYHGITAIFTSKNGEYFCACTNRKQLCLYKRSTRSLISNRTLVRAASRARFTPGNDIVVADKSGDAYLFETKNPHEPGKLILGHLSMLLDVLVTEDSKHIVTTDRDEKIRVSLFPNAYNITSYCLGHEKFVTAIAQLPKKEDILVSGGGDGQLKFWNYANGTELASHRFSDKISKEEVDAVNESLKSFELTDVVETLPVKHLRVAQFDEDNVMLVLTFYASKRVFVYCISKELHCEFLETIIVEEEPLECLLQERNLWILNNNGLKVFTQNEKRFELDAPRTAKLSTLNESWHLLRKNANKQSLFPILYKRKFDNIQEYRARKKSRLGN